MGGRGGEKNICQKKVHFLITDVKRIVFKNDFQQRTIWIEVQTDNSEMQYDIYLFSSRTVHAIMQIQSPSRDERTSNRRLCIEITDLLRSTSNKKADWRLTAQIIIVYLKNTQYIILEGKD